MDTLAFGYILPTTGRIPDLHRLETCAAGRTTKKTRQKAFLPSAGLSFFYKLLPNQIITCAGHFAAHLPQPVHFV